MKKILIAILCAVMVMPVVTFAQPSLPSYSCVMKHGVGVTNCPTYGDCDYVTNNLCGLCCIMDAIYTIADWIFTVFMVVTVLFAIFGAVSILTSASDPAKVKIGRSYILYAAVGLAIAVLSRVVPVLAKVLMGLS